jgi:DNA invertase Pin-like site-specific DNA recombinase
LAGSVKGYSNQAMSLLAGALGRFAQPVHPELTLEELQQLLERIRASEPRAAVPGRVRSVNTERKLGEERVAELLARYTDGTSAHAIGLEFGISTASVMRLVRSHGLEPHDRVVSDEIVREAAKLYDSGLSLQRVADQVGTNKSTVRRALLDAGFSLRPPKHY